MKTPEELAEEWCAEHTCHLQMTCHANAFLAGYAAAQPKWISVKERLPEHDQLVLYRLLIKTKNGQSYKLDYGEWDAERKVFYGEYFDYRDAGWDVTHWMPLPEPPKEEES